MESSIETKIQKDDEEKKIQFLIQIGRESYENHNKKVSNAITITGFVITINGIIILANTTLIQFILNNSNLFFGFKELLIISIISSILSMLSIFLSIIFIHMINPITHDLSSHFSLLQPTTYDELLKVENETLFRRAGMNQINYRKQYARFYGSALFTLGGAIGSLVSLIIIIGLGL